MFGALLYMAQRPGEKNVRTRFNEYRRDFSTSTGKSTFSEHVLNAGREIWPMEETMTILHFENDPRRINALEELEVFKETTFNRMLNIVHNIKPIYRIPHSVQDQTTAHEDNS
jgi:hypothetical protein